MKIHSFAAIIFSCLLVTSVMIPVNAFPDSPGNQNRSAGSPVPGLWSNSDGDWFRLWLDENKTLQCTGLNDKRQCDIPRGLGDFKAVIVGSDFSAALLNNRSVVIWGDNRYGQHNIPPNLTNVIQISTTTNSVAAVLENGSVIAWGKNNRGQTDVPLSLANNVDYILGADEHFVALTHEGNVVAWGDNTFGQCNVPKNMGKIIRISTGGYHTLALSENKTVFAWGWNGKGQCDIPPDIGRVSEISSGRDYSLLHLENRTILVSGSPGVLANEPGPGVYTSIAETNFDSADTGVHDSIAITESGDILTWAWHRQNLDLLDPTNDDIKLYVSNRGIFNLKRVCDKDLLDHRNRSLIYETISANPGIHFNDLCRALEINRGTMSYHLAVLLSSGKVVGMEYAGKTVYFSRKGCFNDTERKLLAHLKNPARMSLLYNLYTHGALQRVDLIDKTRLSRAAATWHLKSLTDEGIVQINWTGRKAYYSLPPEISPHMPGQIAAVPEAGGYGDWSTKGETGRLSHASIS